MCAVQGSHQTGGRGARLGNCRASSILHGSEGCGRRCLSDLGGDKRRSVWHEGPQWCRLRIMPQLLHRDESTCRVAECEQNDEVRTVPWFHTVG